jgi:hypothetical protein
MYGPRFLVMATAIANTFFLQASAASKVELVGDLITMGNGGYPRALVLQDSTLLASYSSSKGVIVRPSHDNGKTWGNETVVRAPHPPEGKNEDLNNVFLYQLPNKDILCAYRRHIRTQDNKQALELNLDVHQSTDGGKTWEYLSSIYHDVPHDGAIGVWEPFLRTNLDGNLEAFWAHERSATNQDTVKKISTDR